MSQVVLILEYDGTRYHGFQYQANAPTIQAELERALHRLTSEVIRVMAASRTDAGVHALGQVVGFRAQATFSPKVWVNALNYYLPPDIAVRAARVMADSFSVRRGALSREYHYYILNRLSPSPLKRFQAYFCARPLDVAAMNQACQVLLGEHDFASFTPLPVTRSQRTVFQIGTERRGELVRFRMVANSFLPHQIRHTVGVLLRVGSGRMAAQEFAALLQAPKPGTAGPALPAQGLFLMKVNYPDKMME